jgi:DNA-binding transcriptional ArsR family regulator
MFKALGDPVRLRLLSLIASSPEVCVCDLTDAFDLTGPTISHHLRVLRETGLVACERRGTWVYYWTRPGALRQLADLLAAAPVPACQSARPALPLSGAALAAVNSRRAPRAVPGRRPHRPAGALTNHHSLNEH